MPARYEKRMEQTFSGDPIVLSQGTMSQAELDWRLRRAIENREEGNFLRALLDATVYAHVPLADRALLLAGSPRLRFIQFVRPDNRATALPFFSNLGRANAAAQANAQVVELKGRDFFEYTLGAELVLDPNDAYCSLYPEEIAELLKTGDVARVEREALAEDRTLGFRLPQDLPDWFKPCFQQVLTQLPYVETAYLVEMCPIEDQTRFTLLIVLGVAEICQERAVRAVSTAMQHRWAELQTSVDISMYDPAASPPWASQLEASAVYTRMD